MPFATTTTPCPQKKEGDGLLQEDVDKLTYLLEVKRQAHKLNLERIMTGYRRDLAQQVEKNECRKFDVVERARLVGERGFTLAAT
jgi:hypothetical protein